jgi:thioredoxin reductase (NADPH)
VGGGNSAAQQAIYLDSIGVLVAMVHRRNELRAEIYLQKLLEDKDIPLIWNSELKEIKGDQLVQSAVLYNNKTGKKEEVVTDGVFVAVGEIPSTQLARDI